MHFHREKANLAVTVCNDKEEIMAHSIFLDYPNWNVAKQDNWISVFRELDKEIPCTVRKHKARTLVGTIQRWEGVPGFRRVSFSVWVEKPN